MFIVLTFRHVAMTGETQREVSCEQCRHSFSYRLVRCSALDSVPLPNLVRRAEQICQDRVAKLLASGIEPVACPACGWMQSHMVRELRRRYAGWIKTIGTYFAVASAGITAICLPLGIWWWLSPGQPEGIDMNWFGLAGAGAAGCALGLLIIALRALLGMLRYHAGGFAGPVPPARAVAQRSYASACRVIG